MTTLEHTNEPSKDTSHQQQCMLYLLGELDAPQSAAFEQRLASSPELGEQLLRQADVIAGLSVIHNQPELMPTSSSTYSPWSIVASIVAIAACLVIVVLGVKSSSLDADALASRSQSTMPSGLSLETSEATEDLLIARAWADSQLNDVSEDFEFAELDMEDALPTAVESSDFDSTLSWMFIAVSANTDLSEEGAANDG
jgi:hypothetical protein